MVNIKYSILIKGENFKPSKYEEKNKIIFQKKVDRDGPGFGKYKKGGSPFGWASIVPEGNINFNEDDSTFRDIITLLKNEKNNLKDFGAETVILDLEINHDNQCNFEFGNTFLQLTSDVIDSVELSCYYSPEELK